MSGFLPVLVEENSDVENGKCRAGLLLIFWYGSKTVRILAAKGKVQLTSPFEQTTVKLNGLDTKYDQRCHGAQIKCIPQSRPIHK